MKKSNLLIAMFTVVVACVSLVKAGETELSFDTAGLQAKSLDGFIRNLPDFVGTPPAPSLPTNPDLGMSAGAFQDTVLYKLGKGERQILNTALANGRVPVNGNTLALFKDEKADILYNNTEVMVATAEGLHKYRAIFETDNRQLVDLLANLNKTAAPQTRQEVQVCELVEALVTHLLWKVIDGVYQQVAVETTQLVKQCHQEESNTPEQGSGSTYHSGQGGNSDFDVNKQLK